MSNVGPWSSARWGYFTSGLILSSQLGQLVFSRLPEPWCSHWCFQAAVKWPRGYTPVAFATTTCTSRLWPLQPGGFTSCPLGFTSYSRFRLDGRSELGPLQNKTDGGKTHCQHQTTHSAPQLSHIGLGCSLQAGVRVRGWICLQHYACKKSVTGKHRKACFGETSERAETSGKC